MWMDTKGVQDLWFLSGLSRAGFVQMLSVFVKASLEARGGFSVSSEEVRARSSTLSAPVVDN